MPHLELCFILLLKALVRYGQCTEYTCAKYQQLMHYTEAANNLPVLMPRPVNQLLLNGRLHPTLRKANCFVHYVSRKMFFAHERKYLHIAHEIWCLYTILLLIVYRGWGRIDFWSVHVYYTCFATFPKNN